MKLEKRKIGNLENRKAAKLENGKIVKLEIRRFGIGIENSENP